MATTDQKNLHKIAQISKAYGAKGEIIASLSPHVKANIALPDPIFIYFEELPIPFFIESSKRKGKSKIHLKLSGIDTLQEAEELIGRSIYLETTNLNKVTNRSSRYSNNSDSPFEEDLVGFIVEDQEGNILGIIKEIHDFSGNICLTITRSADILNNPDISDNFEFMIPFNDDLLIEYDPDNNKLTLEVAQGLLPSATLGE